MSNRLAWHQGTSAVGAGRVKGSLAACEHSHHRLTRAVSVIFTRTITFATRSSGISGGPLPSSLPQSPQPGRYPSQPNLLARNHERWIYQDCLEDSSNTYRCIGRDGVARVNTYSNKVHRRPKQAVSTPVLNGSRTHMDAPCVATEGPDLRRKPDEARSSARLLAEWRTTKSLPLRLRCPWVAREHKDHLNAFPGTAQQQLAAEIRAFGEYVSPTLAERVAATYVYDEVATMVRQSVGDGAVVSLIGSRAAGMEQAISDLDINIKLPKHSLSVEQSEHARNELDDLHKCLREARFRDQVVVHAYYRHAVVPIIVGTHRLSGLEFQIQNTLSAYGSLEITKAFTAEYGSIHLLFKVLKQMLSMRGLMNGGLGGITSYPLLNMIVAGLKMAGAETCPADVASQLLCLLAFWSNFCFEEHKIIFGADGLQDNSITCATDPFSAVPRIVPKRKDSASRVHLMFEDPADASNNLGKNAYRFEDVRACFVKAQQQLEGGMRKWQENVNNNKFGENHKPLLAWCLEGDYTSFEESRLQLQKYMTHLTDT